MKSINRRRFLQNTGTAAAALAGAPLVKPGWSKASPNDTIHIAVIGLRGRGESHYTEWSKIANVEVAYLCDVDEREFPKALQKMEKLSSKRPKTEVDLRRVLDDKEVHAVSIATPDHWHALAAIWACQAGKDVYVEKPTSHNIWEGRKTVEAARKYNRIVEAGATFRLLPARGGRTRSWHGRLAREMRGLTRGPSRPSMTGRREIARYTFSGTTKGCR